MDILPQKLDLVTHHRIICKLFIYEKMLNTYGQGEWFVSPTIIDIFINDIVEDVKSVNTGIEIDGHNICILLYADDIVFLSDTEEGLQKLLDKVYQWSLKWKIKYNAKKLNILHVRQYLITRTNFNFKLGNMVLPIVTQYKYLGFVITEFIDYNVVAQILTDAANRALGSVINKYKKINGFGYYTYTKPFHSAVGPIFDYAIKLRCNTEV